MITFSLTDAQDTMAFDLLVSPVVNTPVVKETDVETVDNNLSTYYTGTPKRSLTISLGDLALDDYDRLRGFVERQITNRKYPLATLAGAGDISASSMPAKMSMSAQRIVNNCGLVESVEISLRESKQMP